MTTSSTSATSGSPLVVNGLISGINTSSVIQALLQAYQAPINDLQSQQTTLNMNAVDYGVINTDLQSLSTAALKLNTPSSWNLMTASSSNTAIATATSSPGAQAGTATFTVDQLAAGNVLASRGGVSSTGSIVTTASSLLLATGAQALGFSGLSASGALAQGVHTITVSQSSSAGEVTAGTALPTSTAITTGSNDALDVNVNGTAYALTLAPSTGESPSAVVAAINTAAQAASAGFTASLTATGELQLATNEQGSSASISVTGGNALATLGLSSGQSGTGTDAVVQVDGTSTTLNAITAGQQVTLAAPSGSIVATIASAPGITGSLLTAGSASAEDVSTGSGSLGDVVANINNSGLAVTASAVQDAQGSYLLQVSANGTGLAGAVTVDGSGFGGGALGSLDTISQAQNALVTVGGAGGYQLTSSTDVFNNVMSGTAVTVAETGQASVTVSRDASGEASQVNSLVGAANQVLQDIQLYAGYNETTKAGGPLGGSSVLENLQQQVLSIFASSGGSSGYGNSLVAGVTLSSTGTLSFDQSTFESAFQANPTKVAALFTQGGTFSPSSPSYSGAVSFVYAGDNTLAGSYDVQVSQSASQATDLGAVLSGGTVSSAETLQVAEGSAAASYTTSAGESLADVAAGLNQQFAAQGLSLSASVVNGGTQLELASSAYGGAASFQVTTDNTGAGSSGLGGATAGTAASFAGTDVQGTINGVAAVGTGQVLAAPVGDPVLAGLSVEVNATGISSTTDLGSFQYTPGLAQQLQSLAAAASNASTGTISQTITNIKSQSTGLNAQIANYQQIENSQQTLLQNEFSTMEQTLGSLKNESSQIASAIAQLP